MIKLIIVVISLVITIIPSSLPLAIIFCLSEYSSLSVFKSGKIVFKSLRQLENIGNIDVLLLEMQSSLTNLHEI